MTPDTILALVQRYGPTVVAWIVRAAQEGTLERDLMRLVALAERLATLVGPLQSLGAFVDGVADIADTIDIRPAQPEDPAMQRALGPHHGGR